MNTDSVTIQKWCKLGIVGAKFVDGRNDGPVYVEVKYGPDTLNKRRWVAVIWVAECGHPLLSTGARFKSPPQDSADSARQWGRRRCTAWIVGRPGRYAETETVRPLAEQERRQWDTGGKWTSVGD